MKELVAITDAILVVGSKQSSNANRMVEVARMRGGRAYLVDSLADVEPSMLAGVRALGLTASASSPEWLVEQIVEAYPQLTRDHINAALKYAARLASEEIVLAS